ncbi:hypothetical protein ACFYYL_24605 [Actinomadura geliboluensis]|uniref:hypothetical protein n=1 Tax=Actinomadura geliboluensis TaxID=882440 RepID=UPI00368E6F21
MSCFGCVLTLLSTFSGFCIGFILGALITDAMGLEGVGFYALATLCAIAGAIAGAVAARRDPVD